MLLMLVRLVANAELASHWCCAGCSLVLAGCSLMLGWLVPDAGLAGLWC
jgi:hypothetical protein